MLTLNRIDNAQMMEVYVNGPSDANRLYIFAGTAVFDWHRTDDDDWARETLSIPMRLIPGSPPIAPERWIDAVAVASLGSIYFRETASRDRVGFAVDSARAYPPSGDFHEEYGITAQVALRGNDARLLRVSFQLNVLARR